MIEVDGLTKYYGEHAAIRNLAFSIKRGEVIGFLGLNGAGKSTTLKILGCVLLPTAGRVRIDGFDVVENPHEVRKRIGFLPDTPPLYDEMTVGGYLAFVAQLRGVPKTSVDARVKDVEGRLSLREVDHEVIGTLSHGFRQRVGLAQALVHNPQLLILDEPTNGLDPEQKVHMRGLIRGLKGSHTVLVSSHNLSEISETCDRLLVIRDGEIEAQGSEAELARHAGNGFGIEVDVFGSPERVTPLIRAVAGVTAVRTLKQDSTGCTLRVESSSDVRAKVARALVAADVDLLRMTQAEGLESIFLKLTHHPEAKA